MRVRRHYTAMHEVMHMVVDVDVDVDAARIDHKGALHIHFASTAGRAR